VKRLSLLCFAYFLWRSKESKCRPAQGSTKIKIKAKMKPAVAIAAGTGSAAGTGGAANENKNQTGACKEAETEALPKP
jgi:hypothetical protein